MKGVTQIRAAGLADYTALANALRLDTRRMLRNARLDKVNFADPDVYIPVNAAVELLEMSAKAANVEDFGLRLSAMRDITHAGGSVGLLLREEPTLGHVLRAAESYLQSSSDAIALQIQERDDVIIVYSGYKSTSRGQTRQITEFVLGTVFRTLQWIAKEAWLPETVSFTHPAPRSASIHQSFFKTRLAFGASFNGFVLTPADLDAPITASNSEMMQYARRHLDRIIARRTLPFEEKVRELVVQLLPRGRCTGEIVAKHLGIDRVTINRRLASLPSNMHQHAN